MTIDSWWQKYKKLFEDLFQKKNEKLWELIWNKVGALAWAKSYIRAHTKFGLPGKPPSYEDVKERRFPDAKTYRKAGREPLPFKGGDECRTHSV